MLPQNEANEALTRKNTVFLDIYDIKILQYQIAITKLLELKNTLQNLETSLKTRHPDAYIVPLLNYILSLCEGPVLNVHISIRKRYRLLSQFKLCKLSEVGIISPDNQNGTSEIKQVYEIPNIELEVLLPDVSEDSLFYSNNMYNRDLQWKLFHSLSCIIDNSLKIYTGMLDQVEKERNLYGSLNPFGRTAKFNYNSIDDLLESPEASLSLDMAVLISDFNRDTSLESFRKLQLQLLKIIINGFQDKIKPFLSKYYSQLKIFSTPNNTKNTNDVIMDIQSLPHWEYTLHRLYTFIFKSISYMDILISLLRQIYFPNKLYFQDIKIKLRSKNVHDYEEMIQMLEDISNNYRDDETIRLLINLLGSYTKRGSLFFVQPDNVLDCYNNGVVKAYEKLKFFINFFKNWYKIWLHIENNKDGKKLLDNLSQAQLLRMLNERKNVDHKGMTTSKEGLKKSKKLSTADNHLAPTTNVSSLANSGSKNNLSLKHQVGLQRSSSMMLRKSSPSSPRSSIGIVRSSSVKRLSTKIDPSNHAAVASALAANSMSTTPTRSSTGLKRSSSVNARPLSAIASSQAVSSPNSSLNTTPKVSRKPSNSRESKPPTHKKKSLNDLKQQSSQTRQRSSSLQASFHSHHLMPSHPPQIRANSLDTEPSLVNQKRIQENVNKNLLRTPPTANSNSHSKVGTPTSINSNNSGTKNSRHSISTFASLRPKENTNNSSTIMGSPLGRKRYSAISNTNTVDIDDIMLDLDNLKLDNDSSNVVNHKLASKGKNNSNLVFSNTERSRSNGSSNSSMEYSQDEWHDADGMISPNNNASVNSSTTSLVKKVRFAGVPPIVEVDEPKTTTPSKRRSWHSKPDYLNTLSPPPGIITNAASNSSLLNSRNSKNSNEFAKIDHTSSNSIQYRNNLKKSYDDIPEEGEDFNRENSPQIMTTTTRQAKKFANPLMSRLK
ncbi:hypothetical protein TBLA_0E01880 [Henningerozyma blattae CBS 6284]|uniref:Uncharacterized protein n=1 Tax=Henningerozyma blattae (strain ATCC 34711 / CBS 6284 / DSM 70876 / NBRC 10599 / NRRL Y-10934 / UCD 77-7) TaxID=1071380 RepID=I2H4E0_HENB6|nr:hypothetical protein TBLA_0E01880 [Tetrapisispora blattae CBS 6284]CCH61242.1 hypothetical protein TBLA_0E01880 [Tetrapisispora blattae CBS 6284]